MPIFPAAPFRSIERTTNLYLYVIPGIRTGMRMEFREACDTACDRN